METKICLKCKEEKLLECFRKHKEGYYESCCHSCELEYKKKYRNKNKDKIKEYKANYFQSNKQKAMDYNKAYRRKRFLPKQRKRLTVEEIKIKRREYRLKEPQNQRNFHQANRRASELQRTPIGSDLEAIKAFYLNCPKGMVVDHIIPLQGKIISGFHTIKNLQYISSEENLRKGNKFPYYPLSFYKDKGLM